MGLGSGLGLGLGLEAVPPTEVDEYMPNMVAKTAVARNLTANCVEAASAAVSMRLRSSMKSPRKSSTWPSGLGLGLGSGCWVRVGVGIGVRIGVRVRG